MLEIVLRLHILVKGGILCAVVDVLVADAVADVAVEADVLAVVVNKCV